MPHSPPQDADLAAAERWFIGRGLPHFVERRDSAWDIWGRAIPLLVIAYLGLGLNALDLYRWSWQRNVLAGFMVIVVLAVIGVGSNIVRGLPARQRPTSVGPAELALLIVVPTVPSALLGQWQDVAKTVAEGVLVLAAVWAITSYGVLPLLGWAGERTVTQAAAFFNVIIRALPLLLLFQTFLFINAEVWQVAGTLTGPVYWVVLAIFFALGTVFLLTRVPALMHSLNTFDTWEDVESLADPAVARPLLDRITDRAAPPPHDRPAGRQRFNIGLVALFSQAIQITAAAVAMFGFFVLFGFLAIPAQTISGWTVSDTVHTLAELRLGGRDLVLSEPLLRVAGFLGAFSGMYFTVLLSTDSTYREEFAEDIGPELRGALAVRVAYRAVLGKQ